MTDIRRHALLDSTNEEARRLALAGEHGPLWIVAAEQSSGRGRRGREWVSKPGNLFVTHLCEVSAPPEACAQLSFAAALAASDAIACYAPNADINLKWPNDILLERRKVAGILLEAAPNGAVVRLIVGIGINLAHFPVDTEFPAISLASVTQHAPEPDAVLTRLVAAWDAWYEDWLRQGFAPIRAAWLSRAQGLGGNLKVRMGQSETEGVFENLDEDGALLLRVQGGGRLRITAGEVFFTH